ncbi:MULTISPECIES: SRPBCC family protein [Arthrobacter]|uniref:Carbon monoxide dehydrogenase n=1 Tax=Arthrobacter terricola TaxID=2547396 RepID=A0A4R5KIL5_9MICC|nr:MULTISPECIES: SRPBCC family protein [Arthrobacter]MBT8159223.1 SRPBCC family protein [Arthrobacter sp. GN70]TDF94942.1 carbon monoxide dehydrogenase [Arthrobacter terricola]
MELKHRFVVPSSLEETWRSFNQLEEIAPCFPGATLTSVDGEGFTGTVKVKLGPIAMIYAGTGEFVERNEDTHTVVISATGKDKRGNGTAGATVTAVLTQDGEGTAVDVTTDMNVTGKPAQFGRGVIQDISDKLLAQFVECVVGKAGGGAGESAEPAATGDAGADTAPSAAPAAEAAAAADAAGAPPSGAATSAAPPVTPTPAASPRAAAPQTGGTASKPPVAPAAELDLGSTMWPILVRRYGPTVLFAALLVLLVWLIRKRDRG